MKIIIRTLFFMLMGVFSTEGYTTSSHYYASGMTIEVALPSNEPQIFYNFALWNVSGTCLVVSEIEVIPFNFTMLNNKGSLNGVEFVTGETLSMNATKGQRFELSAEPRARVEVTNLSQAEVKLRCST
jgi:hypothetical protein